MHKYIYIHILLDNYFILVSPHVTPLQQSTSSGSRWHHPFSKCFERPCRSMDTVVLGWSSKLAKHGDSKHEVEFFHNTCVIIFQFTFRLVFFFCFPCFPLFFSDSPYFDYILLVRGHLSPFGCPDSSSLPSSPNFPTHRGSSWSRKKSSHQRCVRKLIPWHQTKTTPTCARQIGTFDICRRKT